MTFAESGAGFIGLVGRLCKRMREIWNRVFPDFDELERGDLKTEADFAKGSSELTTISRDGRKTRTKIDNTRAHQRSRPPESDTGE
jgi:hypothetical protein